MRQSIVAAAAGSALLAAGCSRLAQEQPASPGPSRPPVAAASPAPGTPLTVPTPSPSGAAADPARPERITLAFAGDVHFEAHVRRLLDNPATALRELRSSLGAADFAMLNLETAITERGTRVAKAYNFRAPASALDAVAGAGVDAVSLANNHGVDYGTTGLADTLAAKRSGRLPMVGIGATAGEAFAPLIVDVRGVRVAVLGSLQLHEETSAQWSASDTHGGVATNLDMRRLRAATRAAAAKADLVVVFMHWGTDYATCADSWQRRTAAALEADGADLVVGGHAHRPQGAGWLGRSYVAYGLGNFVWWKSQEPDARSGVLTVTVDAGAARARGRASRPGRRTASSLVLSGDWTPMLTGSDGVPRVPRSAATITRLQRVWETAGRCAELRARR